MQAEPLMAHAVICDSCHHQENSPPGPDWATLQLTKLDSSAVFQKVELCPKCVARVRATLQQPLPLEA